MSDQEILSKILQRITRVETKIDAFSNVEEKADEAKEIANNAYISARSAHKRVDKIDKVHFWAGTTIIGGVIIALLSLLFITN